MGTFRMYDTAGQGFRMDLPAWGLAAPLGSEELVYSDSRTSIYEYHGVSFMDWYRQSYAWLTGYHVRMDSVIGALDGFQTFAFTNLNTVLTYDQFYGDWFNQLVRGNDRFIGNNHQDVIRAGAGRDAVWGNGGNDIINGGTGIDTLSGGSGVDTFIFDTRPSSTNYDIITDFSVPNDTIRLENAIFTRLGAEGWLPASMFTANIAGRALDASDRIIYDRDGGQLYYDPDGTGAAARVLFAKLTPWLNVHAGNFIVI